MFAPSYNAVQCSDVKLAAQWYSWDLGHRRVYDKGPFQALDNAWFNRRVRGSGRSRGRLSHEIHGDRV